jgi:hypothetical protein
VATEWLLYREELIKVRKVSRNVEMILDVHNVDVMVVIQFCADVEMYNLYEACLMMKNEKGIRWKVMDDILVDHRLAALPKVEISRFKPTATKVESKIGFLRPESIWSLQKDLILGHAFDGRIEQVFISVLPFSAPEGVPRPYTSQDYVDMAKATSVWNAVHWAPIKFREALCQRLLVLLNIPDPAPPKVTKHHVVTSGAKQKARDKVLVIDKGGNAWTWNCGWQMVGEDGQPKRCRERRAKNFMSGLGRRQREDGTEFICMDDTVTSRQRPDIRQQPMGHAEFKRVIIPAGPEDYARSSFRYTRPWGQWRKGNGPVAHDLFGNGVLLLTDGLHAVVEFEDQIKREVILENLHNVGERTVRKVVKPDEAKKPKRKTKEEVRTEEWYSML